MGTVGPSPTSPFNRTGGGLSNGMNFTRPNFNPNRFRNNTMRDTTQAPILLGLGGALLLISIGLLVARLWSRARPGWRLKADDWTVLGATILAFIQYLILAASVIYGLGRRARFVTTARRRTSLQLLFISQVFWYWSITLVKLSVALLLFRLKHTRPWRFFLSLIMILSVLAVIVQTCFQFLQCRPFSVFWDPRVFRMGEVKCFKRSVINGNIVAFSSVQVALDLIFSFIPITFIRKLHRPRREKIFMCVLMGLGLFASCAAIVRTSTLQGFYTSRDTFRSNVTIALWAVLEQQFALIAATIPTLKAFMEKTLVRIGLFFYDKSTEADVRNRLIAFGFLDEGEELEKDETMGQRPPGSSEKTGAIISPRGEAKATNYLGDAGVGREEKEIRFEDMFQKSSKATEKEFV